MTVRLLPAQEASELKKAVLNLERNLPDMIAFNIVLAKLQRSAFLAYIEQGFTDAQALELVKSIR